jgi:dihydroneopterin aldolase
MSEVEGPIGHHAARLTEREALLFEAGIKLGGVFHQYLGIPVAPTTAAGLARTIERAVRLQPYVDGIRVAIDPTRGPGRLGRGRFGYRYLTPEMLHVRVRLAHGRTRVEVELGFRPDLDYPLMRVVGARTRPRRSPGAPARVPTRSG